MDFAAGIKKGDKAKDKRKQEEEEEEGADSEDDDGDQTMEEIEDNASGRVATKYFFEQFRETFVVSKFFPVDIVFLIEAK